MVLGRRLTHTRAAAACTGFAIIGILLLQVGDELWIELGIFDFKSAFMWVTFAALCIDVNTVLDVSSNVVGATPATMPSFRIEKPKLE